jgi:hypothetical protein
MGTVCWSAPEQTIGETNLQTDLQVVVADSTVIIVQGLLKESSTPHVSVGVNFVTGGAHVIV